MDEMSSGCMAEIEQQLQGAARQIAPSDWLAKLFSARQIDEKSASDYLTQSAYYKGAKWDLVEDTDEVPGRYYEDDCSDSDEDEDDVEEAEEAGEEAIVYVPVDPWQNGNDRLQQRFMDIFNDVLFYFGLGTSRTVLATESTDDEYDDIFYPFDNRDCCSSSPPHFSTRPDLVLLGEDARQLPRALDWYSRSMSANPEERLDLYRGCVAVGKVQKVGGRGRSAAMLAKLATGAQECFLHQPSRRFVFGFILSRTSFQLVYFDRSGAVECMPLDIHLNAVQLVQTIRMMGDRDLSMLGFDPSVYWENGRRYVDVMGRTPGTRKVSLRKYEIEHIIYQRPQLLGSGTTCWVVKAVGGVESVLMKDTWRDEGHNEEEFLTLANKQNILGVVKLHIIDQSRTRTGAPSISSLRHDQHIAVTGNRLFSRLILELQRPSVTHFDSGIHLLRGLRDAVSAHHRLVKSGLLHRDISPENILLCQRRDQDSPFAILADLGKATYCDRGMAPADKDDMNIGTRIFRSENNALAGADPDSRRRRHDFLDDLESFFWVYVWVMMTQNGPGEEGLLSKPCVFIAKLIRYQDLVLLHAVKHIYMRKLTTKCEVVVTPYFSHLPYTTLLDNLRNLLNEYNPPKNRGEDLFPHMGEIYSRYLAYFDSAIDQLGGPADPMDPSSPLDATITPSLLPLRRIQPDRLAKRALNDDVTTRGIKKPRVAPPLPVRSHKRARDDNSVTTREPKKRKISGPSANPRAQTEKDAKSSSSKLARRPLEGTRRSQRIRNGKARDVLTGANGDGRTTGSKKT